LNLRPSGYERKSDVFRFSQEINNLPILLNCSSRRDFTALPDLTILSSKQGAVIYCVNLVCLLSGKLHVTRAQLHLRIESGEHDLGHGFPSVCVVTVKTKKTCRGVNGVRYLPSKSQGFRLNFHLAGSGCLWQGCACGTSAL
jgi:hypothetical protein